MPEKAIRRRLREETGSALLASFMLTVLITGAGLTAMTASSVALNKSRNLVNEKQATYMAEAALNHANLYLHQNIANWASYATTTTQTLIPSTSFAGVGSYTVTVKTAGATGGSQSALLLTATGTGLNKAKKSIATVVDIEAGNLQKNAYVGCPVTVYVPEASALVVIWGLPEIVRLPFAWIPPDVPENVGFPLTRRL